MGVNTGSALTGVRTLGGGGTGAQFDGALKTAYQEPMQNLLPQLFVVMDWLKSEGRINKKANVKGDQIVFAAAVKQTSGVGARGEYDDLPTIDKSDLIQGYLPYRKGFKGRIGVSYEAMKYGAKGEGSFVDVIQNEIDMAMLGLKQQAGPAFWGSGHGILAGVPADTGQGTTVTVSSSETWQAYGDSGSTLVGCLPGTRWLHAGAKYRLCSYTAATQVPVVDADQNDGTIVAGDSGEVDAILTDTTFSCVADQFEAAGANLYLLADGSFTSGSALRGPTTGFANETGYRGPQGFLSMCDDGTMHPYYCGINQATYPSWKANVLSNSGTKRALTLKMFYQCFFKTWRKSATGKINLVAWMNPDMLLELVDLLEHFVEFKPRQLEGGFEEVDIMINGNLLKIKVDPYCPGYIFLIDPTQVEFAETVPLEIGKETGSEWIAISNKDAFEARLRWNWQLYTKRRNAHGIIADLNYTVQTV